MSEHLVAKRLLELIPTIMERWDERVRAEVPPAARADETILRNSLARMLEVMAKVLSGQTDPQTAARDLAYITVHAQQRATQSDYSLEALILECQILQDVVLEALEAEHRLDTRDRGVVIQYFNEMVRVAAGEYVRAHQRGLQDYTDRLAKADRAKDEFLAMLGHELRNPLGAISTALFLLQEGATAPTLPNSALDVATRQARHMKQMVDELLDLARINEGKIALQTQPVELGTAIQQALAVAQELFFQREHVVSVLQPKERIYVTADPVRLGQCLSNLLANAAKYTNPGGQIDVSLERDDHEAVIRLRDNGIGIAAPLLPHVFDLFEQAGRGPDRSGGGLGIGLTIVQRLISLHGGRVEAKSKGLGKGSEFVVRLPILDGAPPEQPTSERHQPTVPLKVLLVEDNADAAQMMTTALKLLGHRVAVARDAPTALAAVSSNCPDVALIDIGLPGMNGYELAAKLRASGVCPPSMKLVALSSYAEDAPALAAAGFDSYLMKPVDFEQLEETFASVAAGRLELERLED